MKSYIFEKVSFIKQSPDKVFDFFSCAENLEKVTPHRLQFKILSPLPIEMRAGCIIDYQLKIYGITVSWQTEISVWEPPHRFVDLQAKGPYRKWIHEHRFEEVEGGTRMVDVVEYAVPGGWFAPMIHKLFVKKDIEAIFRFREGKYEEIFN